MDTTTLAAFRQGVYATFGHARDALFEVADALLTAPQPRSFVELSQAPVMRRRWPSCYAALADGRIDRAALRRLFAAHLPPPAPGTRLALALDTSPIHRPEAATVADRTLVDAPNAPTGATPVLPGRACSTPVALPDPVSSWTSVLDNRRVPSTETATTVGTEQLAALLPLLPGRPVLVADGHYGAAAWVAATAALPCDQLLRAKRTAVLHHPAPPRTGKRGRPMLDGPRFQGSDPATHGPPDAQWQGSDARGQALSVACWGNLHLKACRASASRRSASCGLVPPTPNATHARRGSGGSATPRHRPRRCRPATRGASASSMATSLTSTPCYGTRRACGRPRNSSAGWTWWRRPIISRSWLGRWLRSRGDRGMPGTARRAPSRCGGRWDGLSPTSGRPLARPDHAEKRRGGHLGPWSAARRAIRCSAKPRRRPRSPAPPPLAPPLAPAPPSRAAHRGPRGGRHCPRDSLNITWCSCTLKIHGPSTWQLLGLRAWSLRE
jgi:hypothetical protein